jgi:hypothetical protein
MSGLTFERRRRRIRAHVLGVFSRGAATVSAIAGVLVDAGRRQCPDIALQRAVVIEIGSALARGALAAPTRQRPSGRYRTAGSAAFTALATVSSRRASRRRLEAASGSGLNWIHEIKHDGCHGHRGGSPVPLPPGVRSTAGAWRRWRFGKASRSKPPQAREGRLRMRPGRDDRAAISCLGPTRTNLSVSGGSGDGVKRPRRRRAPNGADDPKRKARTVANSLATSATMLRCWGRQGLALLDDIYGERLEGFSAHIADIVHKPGCELT